MKKNKKEKIEDNIVQKAEKIVWEYIKKQKNIKKENVKNKKQEKSIIDDKLLNISIFVTIYAILTTIALIIK